jgi:segregation and condensation protein B
MNGEPAQTLRLLEAVLFASDRALTERELARELPAGTDVAGLLADLRRFYADRGVNLVRAGEGWSFVTAADLAPLLAEARRVQTKLSRAAVETLAIIAYHQPVTRTEIEDLRGVQLARGTLDALFEQGWVAPCGRRKTPGRPMQWATTDGFLRHFGLESLRDLPDLDDLRAAGLLEKPVPPLRQGARAEGEGREEDPGDD